MDIEKEKLQINTSSIPQDWQIKSLGKLGSFSKGQGIRKDESQSGIIPCIRYGELYTRHYDYIKSFYSFISKEISLSSKRLKTGDILFAGSGETKEEIGKCAAFIDNIEAYAGGDIVILSPTNANSLFLGYILNSPFVQKQKASRGQGDAIVHISATQLANIIIPLPPTIEEQSAIATALSDTDALITSLEKLIAKKRSIKQGAMQELFKPKKGWVSKKLVEIGRIDSDNLNSTTSPDYSFKYISLEDVDFGVLQSFSEVAFNNAPSRARRRIKENDILISTVRPNLKSHLLFKNKGSDWVCSTGFSVLRCQDDVACASFIFNHFFGSHINQQIDNLITGSNYPAISNKEVKQLTIPLPSLDEQIEIATILSDMESEINSLEFKLSKYRQIKTGMMQTLLTGQIRLV